MTHVRKVLSAAGEDVFALPRKANVGRFAFDEDERPPGIPRHRDRGGCQKFCVSGDSVG